MKPFDDGPSESDAAQGKKGTLASVFGGVVFFVTFVSVFGLKWALPFGLAAGLFMLLVRFGPRASQPLAAGVSLLWGHLGWLLAGLVLGGSWGLLTLVEVGLFAVAGALLLRRPALAWVIAIGVLEGGALLLHALQFIGTDGWQGRSALLPHLVLRPLVIFALVLGWRRFRNPEPVAGESAPSLGATLTQAAPAAATRAAPGGWIRCSRCGLGHRARVEGTCPKCAAPYGEAPAVARETVSSVAHRRFKVSPVVLGVGVAVVALIFADTFGWLRPLLKGSSGARPQQARSTEAKPTEAPTRTVVGTARLKGMAMHGGIQIRAGGDSVNVGADGRFEVRDPPQGPLTVRAVAGDTAEGEVSAEVVVPEQGVVAVLPLELTPVGGLRGTITFGPDSPGGGNVTLQLDGTDLRASADAQGRFEFTKVPVGEYTLRVASPSHAPVTLPATVHWRRTTEVEVPPLRLQANAQGCTPTARQVGPTSRDLVGAGEAAGEDGKRDWLFSLQPCRSGVIRGLQLAERRGRQGWDTLSGNPFALLGVARVDAPEALVNGAGGEVSVEVEAAQRLLLYVGQEPDSDVSYELQLEYADGSRDVAQVAVDP